MQTVIVVVGAIVALVGVAVLAFAVATLRRPETADAVEYLRGLEGEEDLVDQYQAKLAEPFLSRVVRPLGAGVFERIATLSPRGYLDRVHHQLLLAGLTGTVRADEFVTAQVLSTLFGFVLAVGWASLRHPPANQVLLGIALLPAIGALAPNAWLNRRVAERRDAILGDLPDVLDLLAISVEAGVGFEGAIEVACAHFSSPLGEELSRTLREMELGLSRREAFHNLKRRTEVPELSNFVLALTQADALGMPVGRVLKAQAAEMRTKRRQWAREKAGKLPVKILVPLVVFIFPAVLVVILGPAAASIAKGL